MNEDELRNFQMWNMTKYEDFLVNTVNFYYFFQPKIIFSLFFQNEVKSGWLDDYLRPELKRAFIHSVKMSEHTFLKDSRVFEMFGLDFLFDTSLNLWFIESNASPVMQGTSEEKALF